MPEPLWAAVPGTATERLVSGRPGDKDEVALVFKRAYRLAGNGECVALDEAVPLDEDSLPWEDDVPPPRVSPPRTETDLLAFKPATDLVVQGHVYAPPRAAVAEATIACGPIRHVIRAHGERAMEWQDGGVRFTPPEPFERVPLRYDRAYGGFDAVAHARAGDAFGEGLASAQPTYADALRSTTPFHYPRNPSGCGFLIRADAESVAAARVPSLEFPFDPVTPERIAIGDPLDWLAAPLPAGADWCHPAWFPRIAHLGFVPAHRATSAVPLEVERGWMARTILSAPRGQDAFFDAGFQQGASPGLALRQLPAGAEVVLSNLSSAKRELRVRLPARLPAVRLSVGHSDTETASTRLSAVVIRPDEERVTITYSARREAPRRYASYELAAMRWSIEPR
jgi:hypothetical protein